MSWVNIDISNLIKHHNYVIINGSSGGKHSLKSQGKHIHHQIKEYKTQEMRESYKSLILDKCVCAYALFLLSFWHFLEQKLSQGPKDLTLV